jgi:hypothetical protein
VEDYVDPVDVVGKQVLDNAAPVQEQSLSASKNMNAGGE